MRTIDTLFVALLAGSVLGGCSRHADRIGIKLIQPANVAANDQVGQVVDRGRHHLDDGHFALAISQFREALRLDPEQAAAHNGLAVAYASIGRTDLARRHFELAVAYGPTDPNYQRNYDRFIKGHQVDADGAAALVRASTDEGPQKGAVMAKPDGSWQLPAPTGEIPEERGRAQSPILVDGSGVVMLLSRPTPARPSSAKSKTSAKSKMSEPARPDVSSYTLAAFGLAPMLRRTSLYEVRLVTIAAPSKETTAISVARYNGSIAEASFWGAVDRARLRAEAMKSAGAESECGVGAPRALWAAQLIAPIRQCSA